MNDPNEDLIGYTMATRRGPGAAIRVTGTSSYSDQYVYCDVLNVYGAKIATTVRQAKLVRAQRLAVTA